MLHYRQVLWKIAVSERISPHKSESIEFGEVSGGNVEIDFNKIHCLYDSVFQFGRHQPRYSFHIAVIYRFSDDMLGPGCLNLYERAYHRYSARSRAARLRLASRELSRWTARSVALGFNRTTHHPAITMNIESFFSKTVVEGTVPQDVNLMPFLFYF